MQNVITIDEHRSKIIINRVFESGDKWQLKTKFLAIFDPGSSIVKSVFDYRLPSVSSDLPEHLYQNLISRLISDLHLMAGKKYSTASQYNLTASVTLPAVSLATASCIKATYNC